MAHVYDDDYIDALWFVYPGDRLNAIIDTIRHLRADPKLARQLIGEPRPRTWTMPHIPADVTKLRAATDGSTWTRHPANDGSWVCEDYLDPEAVSGNPEIDLIADLGPLTEIIDP